MSVNNDQRGLNNYSDFVCGHAWASDRVADDLDLCHTCSSHDEHTIGNEHTCGALMSACEAFLRHDPQGLQTARDITRTLQDAESIAALAARWEGRQPPANPIPRIVHQSWRSCELRADQAVWQRSCTDANPEWTWRLWTDSTNRQLVQELFPGLLPLYDSYDMHIKRVDAVRLLYLFAFGGVYMDLDFACLRPLDAAPLPDGHVVLGYQTRNESAPNAIANAWMAAPPGHPFVAYLISRLRASAHLNVHWATGPEFLTHAYLDYARQYGGHNITVVSMPRLYPLQWNDGPCRPICGNGTTADEIRRCAAFFDRSVLVTFWTNGLTWRAEEQSWLARAKRLQQTTSHRPATAPDRMASPAAGTSYGSELARGRLLASPAAHRCEPWCDRHRARRADLCTAPAWRQGRWCTACRWCRCY